MQDALQLAARLGPTAPGRARARRRLRASRSRTPILLLAAALLAFPLCLVRSAPRVAAQADAPRIEVVQTLIVEPATDAPLSLHLKTKGTLPPQSFVRIKGLPPAASLSEGHFVRPGVWALPLSALSTVRITVPAAQTGRAVLTISLVTHDNAVLAEAKTTLVVGAASLFTATPPPAPKGQSAVLDGPEVTLRMKGGAFELRGRLKAFEGGR